MVHLYDLPVASVHKFATGRQSQRKNVPGQYMTTVPHACLVVACLLLGALNSSDAGKQNTSRYYTMCVLAINTVKLIKSILYQFKILVCSLNVSTRFNYLRLITMQITTYMFGSP